MDQSDFISSDNVVEAMNVEVKRVADLFRFLLKYKEQFQASGIEFSDLRQYMVTDDASRIDWKHSANVPDLYVKEYEEERDMDTFIILDVSDSMLFGTADKLKAEYAAIMASALVYASIDAGINSGIGMFGDDSTIILPDGGQVQYRQVLHEVTKFSNYGGIFDLEDSLKDVIGQIKDNTALFVISDFLNVGGEWKPSMTVSSEKFRHVMSVIVRDLRDYKLPPTGYMRFNSPDGRVQKFINTSKIREEFEEKAKEQEEEIKSKLNASGTSFLKVDTRKQFSAEFASYFDKESVKW